MSEKKTDTPLMTKEEALGLIAKQLRKPNLDVSQMVRLINLQSKLAGWDKQPEEEESEEENLAKMVAKIEQQRKQD